jgi:hypothetical protein
MGGDIAGFITRWKASGGSEQANSQLFLAELCDVLDLPRPEPAHPINEENTYSFERKVYIPRGDGTGELKRLDLYRKGCFVLESKQGQDKAAPLPLPGLTASAAVKRGTRRWEDAMQRARRQSENYILTLIIIYYIDIFDGKNIFEKSTPAVTPKLLGCCRASKDHFGRSDK